MLINILPPTEDAHLSAVVFSVVFEDLEFEIPNPPSWTNQLQNLHHDDLELPQSIHALDKAVGIICLLQTVTFDLAARAISAQFLDGSVQQLPLMEAASVATLKRIVLDVNESSFEIEQEQEREREREREKERKRLESSLPPSTTKVTRHKKQRSILMALVASIIPLYNPSSHSRLPSPPPTPISERKPISTVSPRNRRRRARSELVDAFRRYALAELSQVIPHGGYYSWIIQSMLRKAVESMERLVRQAGGSADADSVLRYNPEEAEYFSITAESLPPTPSVSDDEGETLDTDTDGSSIHTPSSHFSTFRPVSHPPEYVPKRHSHASGSPRRFLSESDHALYTKQAALTSRLRRLLILDRSRQEQEAEDIKHHHNVLEIRSRRRAWLNKALVGGVRNQSSDVGMAMPFRSSPLALRSWSGDDYEYAPEEPFPCSERTEYDEYDKLEPRTRRMRRSTVTRLFPVSEEDTEDDEDEDEVQNARELELQLDGFEVDLEGGVRCEDDDTDDADDGHGLRVAFEIERPQIRPRVRTSSMYKHRLHVPPPAGLGNVAAPPSQQPLTSSSLLCQPLLASIPHQGAIDFSQPPVYTEVDVNLNVGQLDITGYGGFSKYTEDEFTLSMDLPLSVRRHDRDVLANRRRLSVETDHGWFSRRLSEPPGNLRSTNILLG